MVLEWPMARTPRPHFTFFHTAWPYNMFIHYDWLGLAIGWASGGRKANWLGLGWSNGGDNLLIAGVNALTCLLACFAHCRDYQGSPVGHSSQRPCCLPIQCCICQRACSSIAGNILSQSLCPSGSCACLPVNVCACNFAWFMRLSVEHIRLDENN